MSSSFVLRYALICINLRRRGEEVAEHDPSPEHRSATHGKSDQQVRVSCFTNLESRSLPDASHVTGLTRRTTWAAKCSGFTAAPYAQRPPRRGHSREREARSPRRKNKGANVGLSARERSACAHGRRSRRLRLPITPGSCVFLRTSLFTPTHIQVALPITLVLLQVHNTVVARYVPPVYM